MKFYTNVEQAGNNLLVRGYEGGQAFSYKVKFNPTLYLPSSNFSKWKTLEGAVSYTHLTLPTTG